MKNFLICIALLVIVSCKENKQVSETQNIWEPYNDSLEVIANADHEISRMQYKLVQSKVLDKNDVFLPLYNKVSSISESDYNTWKPLILEQNIPNIQSHILAGNLTYEKLVLFYLYRIYKYELNKDVTLNTIISLNKDVIEQAKSCDEALAKFPDKKRHQIYGMPILLKDNIDTKGMKTTAGAIAFMNNETDDAFVVTQLKKNGALILGKVNLSEWAYFLCTGCPVGYSAVGGQTLNPYGRKVFETGGSSSGSGTAVAANYAVVAVGTETSGSILSPSSQNSVVGLKPTIGLLSRSGIVPISSTLDTPGPMAKNVIDTAILLSAMTGKDNADKSSVTTNKNYVDAVTNTASLSGKRFGAFKNLIDSDSIYATTINTLKSLGATIVEFTPNKVDLPGFRSILSIDMKNDLPSYIQANVLNKDELQVSNIPDLIEFNKQDSLIRIPYGQALFEGIVADSVTAEGLNDIIANLENKSRAHFNAILDENNLDAILSVNNYYAGFAAVAKYPALTVPMGYKPTGEPESLTFIGKQFEEYKLLQLGVIFEQATKIRKTPFGYIN
ncbi:amidase [Cellulophaga baltica]|uniref:amidase family protein n=1 Tax=Cellulophaga TaxID=104264 RepID=UPI001C067728|nr:MULTISPECIES: amidase family protein [Cellulophaga]MBU2998040.1 amidase [Cellulophaga baltica]MDO6769441.1 amidase family protein [Cellulophaga sp. 1_MG-2023]